MAQVSEVLKQYESIQQDVYEIFEEEKSVEDLARFDRKMPPPEGDISMDSQKFEQTKRFARLYRGNGELALVPLAQYAHYLRKVDRVTKKRIFFAKPPVEAAVAASDPCPVTTGGEVCGRRLLNQFELIKHIQRKHGDVAAFYLSQRQIDAALGKISYNPGNVIPDVPITPIIAETVEAPMPLGVVVEDVSLEIPAPAASRRRKTPNVPHADFCATQGRLGKYTENCARCYDLQHHG